MRVTPKTEAEIQEENCLPAGTYDFEIIEAEETTSKNGNEMIALKLRVFKPDGGSVQANDWLLDKIPHKLKHCAEQCGLADDYAEGMLAAESFVGKQGKVQIVIKKDDQYGPQNAVKDYGEPKSRAARNDAHSEAVGGRASQKNVQANMGTETDDVPF